MANHQDGGQISTDFDMNTNSVVCMANKDFVAGEEFSIFYGIRANCDLLVHNGFAVEANESDSLVLKLGISKNDALVKEKLALLTPSQGQFLLRGGPDPPEASLMSFLRVMCIRSKEEVEKWSCEKDGGGFCAEMDQRALQYLLTRCTLLLKSYPTTLEEDVDAKAAQELTQIQKYCIYLRMGEKKILNDTIKFCKEKLSDHCQ